MQLEQSKAPPAWQPTRKLAERLGVCTRTIERWEQSGILPEPKRINGRKYWPEGTEPRIVEAAA